MGWAWGLLCTVFLTVPALANVKDEGFSATPLAENVLLAVGVPDDLPGVDIDLINMTSLALNPAYQFLPHQLWDKEGTKDNILKTTTKLVSQVSEDGTFLFYFTGHGDVGLLWAQDGELEIEQLRLAIERGRRGKPKLRRLVLIFDSCNAGSLIDPFSSNIMADSIQSIFTSGRDDSAWKSLFVFASSRADELSEPSDKGSEFTLALMKAYDEVFAAKGSLGALIEKTKAYTEHHHPVERLFPESLRRERL